MERLKEMIKLAHKKAIRRIEVLHPQQSRGSKLYKLYSGIHDGKYESDEEAAADLYQSDANDTRYQKLKNRLNNRLMNTLLYIDGPKSTFSEADQKRIKCQRSLVICQILAIGYARKAALNVARRGLLLAERYEFSDLAFGFCRILMANYFIRGKKRELNEIIQRQIYHQEMMIKTSKADHYYTSFAVNFIYSQGKSPELMKQIEAYCDELTPMLKEPGPFSFFYSIYLLLGFRYELARDYENLFKFTNEALEYFASKPHLSRKAIFSFELKKLVSAIYLQRFEEGEKAALSASQNTIHMGSNWFMAKELHITLHFHAQQYQKAFDLWVETTRLKPFIKATDSRKESWLVLEAFIHFLIAAGHIETNEERDSKAKTFRIGRFLNTVPKFSVDKKGNNIPILILQILFLIQQKRYGEVSDRTEALNAYCYRYLRKDDTFRSNCFIKMLMVLPKAQFHKAGVVRQAGKYYQQLLKSNENRNTKSSDIEPIPYEALWQLVLGMLDNRFR